MSDFDVRRCRIIGITHSTDELMQRYRTRRIDAERTWEIRSSGRSPYNVDLPMTMSYYIAQFLHELLEQGDGFVEIEKLKLSLESFYYFNETFFYSAVQLIVDEMIDAGIELECRTAS